MSHDNRPFGQQMAEARRQRLKAQVSEANGPSKEPLGQEAPLSVPVACWGSASELRQKGCTVTYHERSEYYDTPLYLAAPSVKDMGDRADALVAARDAARWALCERADGAGKGKCSDDCVCVDEGSKAAEAAVRAYFSALSEASNASGPSQDTVDLEKFETIIEALAETKSLVAAMMHEARPEVEVHDHITLVKRALAAAADLVRAPKSPKETRDAAIEECAVLADKFYLANGGEIAHELRALKSSPVSAGIGGEQ